MIKIQINEEEIARRIANILLPEMQAYQKLLNDSKGKDDEYITMAEAMKMLKYTSRTSITERFQDGSLTKHKDRARVLISKNEVLALIRSKAIHIR